MARFPLLTIHSDFYERRYLCKRMTAGYTFKVVVLLIVFIVPFLTTYSSGCKSLIWPIKPFSILVPISYCLWATIGHFQEQSLCWRHPNGPRIRLITPSEFLDIQRASSQSKLLVLNSASRCVGVRARSDERWTCRLMEHHCLAEVATRKAACKPRPLCSFRLPNKQIRQHATWVSGPHRSSDVRSSAYQIDKDCG